MQIDTIDQLQELIRTALGDLDEMVRTQPVDGDGDGGPIRIEVCWQGEGEAA